MPLRRPSHRPLAGRLAAPIVAVALVASALSPLAAPAQEPETLQLRDRILAVVDDDPILASDVERIVALGLAARRPGESPEAFSRRVLEILIEQRVRLHEVNRYGLEQVPVEEIEAQVSAIRDRFESEEAFREQLAAVGMDLATLRQLVARQLIIYRYFEESLGRRVFVGLEETREYYNDVLVPAAEARGEEPPPLEAVREEIRSLLREERLNAAIEARTEELRLAADIVVYFDSEHDELPPLLFELTEPTAPPEG